MRESKIEAYFTERVKRHGGEVRKVKWIGRAHAPDRLALLPRVRLHFYAELKATGKSARSGQAREHERMRAAGMKVYVLDDYAKINKLFYYIEHLGELPNDLH